jgi:hypothetical protein
MLSQTIHAIFSDVVTPVKHITYTTSPSPSSTPYYIKIHLQQLHTQVPPPSLYHK